MIFKLDQDNIAFPNPELAEPDGLLAVGGDLSEERLMLAYRQGIFPWYSDDSPILWYSPHERFVLFPESIKISKSMQQVMNSGVYTFTYDSDFEAVIKACAAAKRKDQNGTWITTDMQEAYIRLYKSGFAHSVEVWQGEKLAGGLYGIAVNNVFCGESMFSETSNASKAGLVWFCKNQNYKMIDCQIYSAHMERMGAEKLSRKKFMQILRNF